MATVNRLTINDTGFVDLPAGTTAQRPGSPVAGMVRYNTTTQAPEFYNGTVWTQMFAGIGMSPLNPAQSAEEIQCFYPEAENGYYWIRQIGTTAFQHYCVFKKVSGDPIEGGPWTVPLINATTPSSWSTTGSTAIDYYQSICEAIGVATAGRGLETYRTASDAYGGWLATKIAIHQISNGTFFYGKSAGGGGLVTMPMLNINGEGGTSDHRIISNRGTAARITTPFQVDGDACNANQLFCGAWGATDVTSWYRYDDIVPGPEDWGPANSANTSTGGTYAIGPNAGQAFIPQLAACTYK